MKRGLIGLPLLVAACSLGFGENFSGGPDPLDASSDAPSTTTSDAATTTDGGAGADGADGAADVVTRGLLLYYRFDEPSGDVAKDSAANANDGHLVAGASGPPSHIAGKIGGALAFAGGSYVEVAKHPSMTLPASFSAAYWVKTSVPDLGAQPRMFTFEPAIDVKLNGRTMQISINGQYAGVGYSVQDERWTHYAMVFDAGRATWFVDGFKVDNAFGTFDGSKSATGSFGPLHIGVFSTAGDDAYNGAIDELRIYGVALTAQEVATLAGR